jgi:hypothetical protein
LSLFSVASSIYIFWEFSLSLLLDFLLHLDCILRFLVPVFMVLSVYAHVDRVFMIGSTLIIIRNKMVQHDSDSGVLDNRSQQMVQLLDERDLGVLTAVMSLLVALVASNPDGYWSCLPKCVHILERLTRSQDILQEYTYYGIPSPWLQVNPMSQ